MPVSPSYSENLARDTGDIYADTQLELLKLITRYLQKDIDVPDWAERKLLQVQLLQHQAQGILAKTATDVAPELATALSKAANRGHGLAMADVQELVREGLKKTPKVLPGLPAVHTLVDEAAGRVIGTHPRILRATVDAYRTVIARSSPQVLLGTQTRVQAAQAALDQFASKGITGFVDNAGKNWALESYVEMATRSSVVRATTSAYTSTLVASGEDLVIVSDSPQECEICRPYEGQVLTLSDDVSRIDGVDVFDTYDNAEDDGLFHPNCTHSVSLYQPGFTDAPTNTANPQGDEDRQHLRGLERSVRQWKRRQAASLDDQAAAKAQAKVRDYQSKIREHVASTSAKRQPARERLGAL